ncbi:MAG: class I SAM-dependent methyltransferase [Spartobacteria bacterium]
MSDHESDSRFSGPVPKLYERYMVPLIFQPYAADMVSRLPTGSLSRVLEIAAGTGVVTRELARALPENVEIVATDLNEGMLEHAQELGTARPVEWRQADAAALPFPDDSFDAVVCQFGAMFFPDKAKAFAEARRVLRPGGMFLFSTWDRIQENEFVDTVTTALKSLFPEDPPRFHARVPHGYHDIQTIERDVIAAGFDAPEITTVAKESHSRSAREVGMAYCQGTPLRTEIEERDASLLSDATVLAIKALTERFGKAKPCGKIQAHVVRAIK